MKRGKVVIHPGICGLPTTVEAESEDGMTASVKFATACDQIKAFGEKLKQVDGFAVCLNKISENPVYEAGDILTHPVCPVLSGTIKAVELACSLALPAEVSFHVELSEET